MGHTYGRAPGNVTDKQNYGMLDIPGMLTFLQAPAGAVDLNDMGAGDSLDTLTVAGTDILEAGGGAVTFTTDLATTARLVANTINSGHATHGYWARIKPAATDWVQIFKNSNSADDTSAVSGTDTGFTPAYVNFSTEIAYAAAVRKPSWNYGIDVFPGTNVYQIGFDFAPMGHSNFASSIASAKAVELIVYPEDQVVYGHIGPEGVIYCPSAAETVIDVKGCMEGDATLFLSAAAATNCGYRLRVH